MVMTEVLFMEVLSIIIQRSSKSLDPVVEDMFQFRPLNLVQKCVNAVKRIPWSGILLACQYILHTAEKLEVRECDGRALRRIQNQNNVILVTKKSEAFEW
jgi:hypothetical protein